jgi:transposase
MMPFVRAGLHAVGVPQVTIGVDTHAEVHVAAAIDGLGRELGHASFPTTPAGYRRLWRWAAKHGRVVAVGVEGTGVYGAGLTRHLADAGVRVVEVDRPDRKVRRFQGKSDPLDAYAAARAVLSGRAATVPKLREGRVEMIRTLHVTRRSAVKAAAQAKNQLHAEIKTAPDQLRTELRDLTWTKLCDRCARLRPGELDEITAAVKFTLRSLARRIVALETEIAELDRQLHALVNQTAPTLSTLYGVGLDVAATMLIAAGDNPDRLENPAAFAHLCGAAPIPASSGKTQRHRLNRGGNRQANHALWIIAMVRLRHDPRTRTYRDRRTTEGKTSREIVRCLKTYISREIYRAIITDLGPATRAQQPIPQAT